MAFKKPNVKKTIVDISQARIYLRSVKKFGKTTLFRDVILEKYGDPSCGMLLGIGNELGYTMLDELNSTQIESWKDLEEMKSWILSDDEDAKKIKMLGFDTIDELIPIAEKEICSRWSKKSKTVCDSINSAMGGFGKGQQAVCDLIKTFFFDLHKAGIGVFAIAHTKLRNVVDKGSEGTEGYQVLTSNLTTQYEGIFGDIFDIVLTGTIDRGIKDGIATKDERQLYFRGNTRVEAGGRFGYNTVPEYMVFEGEDVAKRFIDIVEEGMRKSRKKPVSDEEYQEYKEQVKKEIEEKAKENIEEIKINDKLSELKAKYESYARESSVDYIKAYFTNNDSFKKKVQETLKNKDVKMVTDLELEDNMEIIRYGVEELGLEMV